jgi:hypothetical protein
VQSITGNRDDWLSAIGLDGCLCYIRYCDAFWTKVVE